jgi:RHS repeat-associated protein
MKRRIEHHPIRGLSMRRTRVGRVLPGRVLPDVLLSCGVRSMSTRDLHQKTTGADHAAVSLDPSLASQRAPSYAAAALLLVVVTLLLLPLGAVLRASFAGTPAATGFTIAADTLSDGVAATAAEFRVDESGAATYSIPLFTVPGVAGVVPQLSLGYSSQGGYGPLGKGWSIGGLSSIARCRATREVGDFIVGGIVTDGNPAPVNFSASDRYCLDGQRLVPSADAFACPAVAGMTVENLRTEIQTFQRVCAYTPQGGTSGVAFFTAERKDGSISWYGDRDNNVTPNRADGYVNTTAPGKEAFALRWAQTRFQDSTGNYIDYTYHEAPNGIAGEHLPATVKYTGRTALPGQTAPAQTPFAQVTFVYALRAADQRSTGYLQGGTVTQAHRLVAIESHSEGVPLRYYALTYAASSAGSGQDTLTQVQECRDNTLTVCAAPTTFTWSAGKYEFATKEYPSNLVFGDITHWRGFKQGDIDGDGRQDLVFVKEGNGGAVCSSEFILTAFSILDTAGRPAYQMGPSQCTTPNGTTGIDQRGDGGWQLLDYNGDGRDDLFISSPGGQGWRLFLSNGRGATKVFDDSQNQLVALAPAIPSSDVKNQQPQLVDLNGDGLTDVVYTNGGENPVARVMERNGSGYAWGAERAVVLDAPLSSLWPAADPRCNQVGYDCSRTLVGPSAKGGFVQLADFNGDAASDVLMSVRDVVSWERSCDCTGPNCNNEPLSMPVGGAMQNTQGSTTQACAGAGFDINTTAHAMTVKSITATTITLSLYSTLGTAGTAGLNSVNYADANGDGLTDLFYRASSGSDWSYRINTGTGFAAPLALGIVDFREHTRFLDINGDGRADVLYVFNAGNYKAYNVRYALPSGGFGPGSWIPGVAGSNGNALLCEGFACDANLKVPMFGDFDGDGVLDFMSLRINSAPDLFVSRAGTRFMPRDVITKFTNGFGAQTQVTYSPLTLKDFYRPDTGTRNAANWGRGAAVQDVLGPLYAVQQVSSSSPQNGVSTTFSTLHYRYNGAKLQGGGRGLLGFREIVTVDPNQTGGYVVTKTQYAQNFPYVGLPTQTTKLANINQVFVPPACLTAAPVDACFAPRGAAGTPLAGIAFSLSTQIWAAVLDQGASFGTWNPASVGPVLPLTSGNEETASDPFNAVQSSRVATTFTYGPFANVTSSSVDTYAGTSTAPMATVITQNTYTDDNTRWRLGRLTASTVTHRRPGVADVVRTTAFTYQMTGAATGLLTEERIQPGGSGREDLRKAYTLDDYGNRIASFVCSQQVTDCRSTNIQYNAWQWDRVHRYGRQEYDARGRFATRSIELFRASSADAMTTQPAEFVTGEVLARDAYGHVTEAVGLNDVRSVARYGALGRAYYAWQQTDATNSIPNTVGTVGATTLTTFRWCTSGSGAVACPARARFRSKTTATASPTQWTYYDVLGREVLKVGQSFNVGVSGQDASAVCTEYDAVGRGHRVSLPFFVPGVTSSGEPDVASVCSDAARKWVRTEFDLLGRPLKVTEANNAVSTVAYHGLTTTKTNARGYAHVEVKNALGELSQATDAVGLSTTYAYTAAGNLARVSRDAGRGAIVTTMSYDTLGRKTLTNDPDAGLRYQDYNAAGEQEASHDGQGNLHYQRFDFRGRVVWSAHFRPDGSVDSAWDASYDLAANGLGQAHCRSLHGYQYTAWVGQSDKTQSWVHCASYDALGRAIASATAIDGVTYSSSVVLDALGRPQRSQDPSGTWLKTEYGTRGHARRLCESSASDASAGCAANVATTYLETQATDAFGNVVKDQRGGSTAMQTWRSYDPLTGRASEICTGSDAINCQLMRDRYVWDAVGNLSWRDRKAYGEDFGYDAADRFEVSRVNRIGGTTYAPGTGQVTDWSAYDTLGNLCAHLMRGHDSTWMNYAGRAGCGLTTPYGTVVNSSQSDSPHQVRQTNAYSHYVYDHRGNQTFADSSTSDSQDRTIRYTAHDQAYEIFKGPTVAPNRMARFWYAPDGSRYKREDTGLGITGTRRTIYIGNLEIVSENGTTTYKRYIGGVLVQNVVNGIAANRYTFTDHLGSIVAIANETGAVIEGGGFNAFGERRAHHSATSITQTGYSSTTRGFTGHEMLDGLDVIHMNGRIYDPTIGRFLQPDPIIQSPDNPQNWNAYSYVFNNPYKYTDPTGYLGQTERSWLGAIVAIAASVFTGGAAAGWWAASLTTGQLFAITVAAGFASGAITTKSFEGGLYGAFGAALSFGVGWAGTTYNWGAGTIVAQAFTGGIVESLQGGNFGAGFVSAWVGAAVAPGLRNLGAVKRVVVAALVGGTLSEITGGKFANGAASWAVSAAMVRPRASSRSSADSAEDRGKLLFTARKISDENVPYRTDMPEEFAKLLEQYPQLQEKMDLTIEDSDVWGPFNKERGFYGYVSLFGSSTRYIDFPEPEFNWSTLTYGRIEVSPPPVIQDYKLALVFHTHPFRVCFEVCYPMQVPPGPSGIDGVTAKALPEAFHVIHQNGGNYYYYGSRALNGK